MTMTTCHPKFTATQRMIVHATLARPKAPTGARTHTMPAAISALYSEVKA